jgi:hypothetical protein
VGTKAHAGVGPGVEVRLHVDGAASSLLLTNGPELLEVAGALDGRGVPALADGDVIGAAVGVDGALALGARGRVVGAEVLDNVVLDQWVGGPAVDGEVRVAVGVVLAGVGDGAKSMLVAVYSLYNFKEDGLTGHFRGSSPCHRRSCRRTAS